MLDSSKQNQSEREMVGRDGSEHFGTSARFSSMVVGAWHRLWRARLGHLEPYSEVRGAGLLARWRWWCEYISLAAFKSSALSTALFGIGKLVLGIVALSPFIVINGVYSLGMAGGRVVCLSGGRADLPGQYRRYRLVGFIIVGSSMLYMAYATSMLFGTGETGYSQGIAIGIATVVFTELVVNIRQVVTKRRDPAPLVHASKLVGLANTITTFTLVQLALRTSSSNTAGTGSAPEGWGGLFFGGIAVLIGLAMIGYATFRTHQTGRVRS